MSKSLKKAIGVGIIAGLVVGLMLEYVFGLHGSVVVVATFLVAILGMLAWAAFEDTRRGRGRISE